MLLTRDGTMPLRDTQAHRLARIGLTVLATLSGLAAGLAGAAGPAGAESDRGAVSGFFNQESARITRQAAIAPETRRPSGDAPFRGFRPEAPRPVERHWRTAPPAAALKPPAPNPHRITVAVFGDRIAQALAAGLQDGDDVAVARSTTDDAGLTRSDFVAWLASIRDGFSTPQHAAVAVMVIGSNDRAPLQDGGERYDPGTPEWQKRYGARVDSVARTFRDAHVALIWVGLPAVRDDAASADYVRFNGIVRDHASRSGAVYVDSWEAFTDDAGRYSPTGPDVDGQTVKLRRADGVGFTHAGARKLASFVETDLNRLRHRQSAAPADLAGLTIERAQDFDAALDIDVNAQIRREAARGGSVATGPSQHLGPSESLAAGPVIPLTAPPDAPDGRLAALPATASENGLVSALAALPVPARPGRADDFAWPRP